MSTRKKSKTRKSEQTKALILQAALEIFHERGYEETTMRAIARQANVSLGNAYYYFRSKEQLIQEFYHRTHEAHVAALAAGPNEKSLKAGLLKVMRLKIKTLAPYHAFAGVLFKTAAHPLSPLNPFAPGSDPLRQESIAVFRDVVEHSRARIPHDLKQELPYLLWLYHMGVILYWIHD